MLKLIWALKILCLRLTLVVSHQAPGPWGPLNKCGDPASAFHLSFTNA